MRSTVLEWTVVGLTLLSSALGRGAENQTPADDSGNKESRVVTFEAPPRGRFYGGAEYLLWWVKPAPLSVPFVSSGYSMFKEGFLVNSSATILYGAPYDPATGGNNHQDFAGFSGTRLTVGYWLDEEQKFAIEAGGFALFQKSAGFSARGDSNGGYPAGSTTTGIRIPVYNSIPYAPGGRIDPETGLGLVGVGEDGVPLALPGDITGGVTIKNMLELWGVQASGVINLYRNECFEVSGLVGVRYLDLSEEFNLTADLAGLPGSDMYKGQSGVATDDFQTDNHFYGGNFGLRGTYTHGHWFAELTTSIAAGLSHEVETVSGYYTAVNSPFGSGGPEGIFAQPANEGRTSSDRFAYVPEGEIKVGYAFTPCIKASLGYNALYYSNVIRPTDQITREIPKGQTFQQDGTSPSTTSPARLFKTSDFYAHGFSVALDFTF